MDIEAGSFVWNAEKEFENMRKHGVGFALAALAFGDPAIKVAIDDKHSSDETRFFCVGDVGGQIITVRFIVRNDQIRIIGAGYWRKGRKLYYEKDQS